MGGFAVGHLPVLMLSRPFAAIFLALATLAAGPSAEAWGCKGHEVVARIAERHLHDRAHQMAADLLATRWLTDPHLTHKCPETGDRFVDASTWADDIRRVRPETGPWHFIDLPRGAPKSDLSQYCPPVSGCITRALAEEVQILRDRSLAPTTRAEALRFAIHFVGDIHQPLHASTNNDLGGNCVPVTFFGHAPVPSGPESATFIPNLHEVWDTEIIERFSAGKSVWDLAQELERKFSGPISAWQKQPTDFAAWAWESHELAEKIAYGHLPHLLPIETPRTMTKCPVRDDLGARTGPFEPDENLADDYQVAASAVIQEQLAKAGARLAALLNSLWP